MCMFQVNSPFCIVSLQVQRQTPAPQTQELEDFDPSDEELAAEPPQASQPP